MAKFAEYTKVPIAQTRNEIETILKRYGAGTFAYFGDEVRAIIMFEAKGRKLRFDVQLPKGVGEKEEREKRRRWRALLLAIKSKLESVASEIETFEEAFLAHIVMPDGITVGQHAYPLIESAYKGEPMQPLLPAPRK